MITIKNYNSEKSNIDWKAVPKAIADNRADVEDIMEFYDDDADIKETVDLFFKGINDASRKKIDDFKKENPLEIVDLVPTKKPSIKENKESKNSKPKTAFKKPSSTPKPKFKVGQEVSVKDAYLDKEPVFRRNNHGIIKRTFGKEKVLYHVESIQDKGVYPFDESEISLYKPKTTKPKPTVKVQSVVEKKYLDNYSTEFQLIRRFWNVIKDEKIVLEFRKAQLLYAAFNKAAIERKVRKTSTVADIFNDCNAKMKVLFEEFMLPNQKDVKVDFVDKALYAKIQDYVGNVTINPVVSVLKRFVSIQNTLPEVKKVETLIKTLQKTKEKFPESRLSTEMNSAIKALQDYIKNPKEPIEVKNYGLSKPKVVKSKKKTKKPLNGIVEEVAKLAVTMLGKPEAKKTAKKVAKKPAKKVVVKIAKVIKPKLNAPVEQIQSVPTNGNIVNINETGKQKSQYFTVKGEVGKFLQAVERKPKESVVITLDGMQGAGKTTMIYKAIDGFASAGNKSLFISGEEHPESALAVEKRDKYLSNEAKKHTAIVGDVENIEQLYKYIAPYDIIFIDSWQKLQRMVGAIRLDEDLRKKFDGKVFVVIFQQTTTGRTKGGAEVVFDGDIIIKMVKEASFADNYAYFDKNRYTRIPIENIRYNIAKGKTYNPNAPMQEQHTEPRQSGGFAFQIS